MDPPLSHFVRRRARSLSQTQDHCAPQLSTIIADYKQISKQLLGLETSKVGRLRNKKLAPWDFEDIADVDMIRI
jgi:hypothetical protein